MNIQGPIDTSQASGSDGSSDLRKPVLIFGMGRGRVGKTVFLRVLGEYFREAGAELEIWNIDQHNQSENLDQFFADTKSPDFVDDKETRSWLEKRIADQSVKKYDAILDVGGNDTLIKKLAEEINLNRLLENRGIRLVAVHVLGPDAADLDYLRQTTSDKRLLPTATILVMNSSLIGTRSSKGAFDAITDDPTVVKAVKNGAKVVRMPELSCMREVIDRRLSFRQAAEGVEGTTGLEPMSFFDQERVAVWLEEKMASLFDSLPAAWLPRVPVAAS
jgi:hypothetical protein